MKSRITRKTKGHQRSLISGATSAFSAAYPRAPIEIRNGEIGNIEDILSKIVEIEGGRTTTDWKKRWAEVDSSWLRYFFSKCRVVHEPPLQEAMAKAFVFEATTRNYIGYQGIDILGAISVQDWKTFTTICSFACSIDGRISPVVFNYNDDIYKQAGLVAEALDGLNAVGLVTQGGTGDTYTLKMPKNGFRITYLGGESFGVRPLSEPIARSYFGRTSVQPHEFDKNLNVGVIDFTEAGRTLGFLTSCLSVDGFTEYLRCRWKEYLHDEDSVS